MRRRPRTSGLPNRRRSVPGSTSAAARLQKRGRLGSPSTRMTGEAAGPSWRISGIESPEDRTGVQGELGQVLGDQGLHVGVMGPRRHLAENDVVASDEQLYAEDPAPAEATRYLLRDLPGPHQCPRLHGLGLPGLAVIPVLLAVADGLVEAGSVTVADGQERKFVVEGDEPLTITCPALVRALPWA
jgi:hypothetical protein